MSTLDLITPILAARSSATVVLPDDDEDVKRVGRAYASPRLCTCHIDEVRILTKSCSFADMERKVRFPGRWSANGYGLRRWH